MKKDVSSPLLIVFSIPLLSMVGCISIMSDVWVCEDLRPIYETAHDDAHDDANVDRCMWLSGGLCLGVGGGCLLGSLGIVAAHFYEPSPPPTRLLGKPPEYVDFYVSNYKEVKTECRVKCSKHRLYCRGSRCRMPRNTVGDSVRDFCGKNC